jgi:hypothetical protein
MTTQLLELDVDGPGAPPRANGELVFAEPHRHEHGDHDHHH